jgi:hypothetical protein
VDEAAEAAEAGKVEGKVEGNVGKVEGKGLGSDAAVRT